MIKIDLNEDLYHRARAWSTSLQKAKVAMEATDDPEAKAALHELIMAGGALFIPILSATADEARRRRGPSDNASLN